MKRSLPSASLLLFGVSISAWTMLTIFESVLVGMSLTTERVITFLCLVLPAGLGTGLGAVSLIRRDRHAWLGVIGVLVNGLFAIFHLMILAFAG
jgi:hypothetical protein